MGLTLTLCKEKHEVPERTRMGYLLKLNSIYYITLLISVLFVPILYGGDGRFYSFLIGVNALFFLFFISLLNPFYMRSTHFPQLEAMTSTKVLQFSLFEMLTYCIMAFLHLFWGYYLTDLNDFNKKYMSISQKNWENTAVYVCTVS